MSKEKSIAESLDPEFIGLMIEELAGRSRPRPKTLGAKSSGEALTDEETQSWFIPEEDEVPPNDGTPLEPLPAIDDDQPAPAPPPQPAERHAKKRPSAPVESADNIVLEICEPNLRERVYRLTGKPVTIGRGRDCDIVLKDTKVSRKHLTIEVADGRITALDMGSQNGTVINNRRIQEQEVMTGDSILLGHTTIRVRRG
jgi:hypothetical protein